MYSAGGQDKTWLSFWWAMGSGCKKLYAHLQGVVGDVMITCTELATMLAQIKACLNSRLLLPIPELSEALELLTLAWFLIRKPLMALPDSQKLYPPITLFRRWHFCQQLISHF